MESLFGPIIGIVQGVTELLPISSSGHLIIVTYLFEKEPEILLLTLLHLASALALTLLYGKDIFNILRSDKRYKFIKNVLIAATPIIIFGVLFEDILEDVFYNPTFIGVNLLFWGMVMIMTEGYEDKLIRNKGEFSERNALIIGLFQVLALIPGTSRSGISTMAGMWSGAKKKESLDFSFMMGIPLLFGAFFFSVFNNSTSLDELITGEYIVAFIFAFLFSYVAAFLLRKYSKERFLTVLGVYRIIVGLIILLLVIP